MEASSKLSHYLSQHGLKSTRQRTVILTVLQGIKRHFTLDDLLAEVQLSIPNVGMATIYRTMKLFSAAGIVTERRFDDGITRYETFIEDDHHDHLICTTCKRIVEFEDDIIEQRQHHVAEKFGFKLISHRMELYGECTKPKTCKWNTT